MQRTRLPAVAAAVAAVVCFGLPAFAQIQPTEAQLCAVTQGPSFGIMDLVTLELKISEGGSCDAGDRVGQSCLTNEDCRGSRTRLR